MAVTIDWLTYIINIPQSYLDPVSGTIYELDTEQFRLDLKAIEASVYGIVNLKTHNHNTTVTVAGTTYARSITILPPYSIEFEDGQYTVILVGSNNNIFDVANGILVQNQVQTIPTNAAGLIVHNVGSGVTAQDKLDIADAVWDESAATHTTTDTFGDKNQNKVPSENITDYKDNITASGITDLVWNEPIADHVTAGTFGAETAKVSDLSTIVDVNAISTAIWTSLTNDYLIPGTLGYDIAKKEDLDFINTQQDYMVSGVGDVTVDLGSIDSGTYLDTQTHNETYLVIAETATGFSVDFTFRPSSGEEIPRLIQFQGRYQGNPSHVVHMEAYNDEASTWEILSAVSGVDELISSSTDYFKEFIISRNHINPATREVKIRILHDSPGSITHRLYIDKINIVTAEVVLSLTEAGIAAAVWNSQVADYTVSGIFGKDLTGNLDYISAKTDINNTILQFISDLESGRQVLIGNQLICYKPDNVTELIRFNLYDSGGSPTTDNVYRRDRT